MKPEEKRANLERVAAETRKLAEPLNLPNLEDEGIIAQEGDWFIVNSFEALPEQASNRIARLKQDDKGIKVQFVDTSELDAIVKKLDDSGL